MVLLKKLKRKTENINHLEKTILIVWQLIFWKDFSENWPSVRIFFKRG